MLAPGQPWRQQHWGCRRAGPGRGAAGQQDVDDAGVRLACKCGCKYGCGMRRCGCVAVLHSVVSPIFWPVLRPLPRGQPSLQQHRRCRRAGPGRGAACQHFADDAGVRLVCGCAMRRCGFGAVAVTKRETRDLSQCSRLHMGSLDDNKIRAAGARDLGAALQVNTTLTDLG